MPLQLPPPLQTPLHTGQGPLQVPSNPPTANDVVRAAANASLVFGTYSMYYTAARYFATLISAFRYGGCYHSRRNIFSFRVWSFGHQC
jgi:hypothetical protein